MSRLSRIFLSDRQIGALSYRLRPASGRAWGGPFNGQAWRCCLVAEIILKSAPVAIVETGTYRGTTTEWMSSFQLPIWSCEASERNFGYAQQRLSAVSNVQLLMNDSRVALREILDGPLDSVKNEVILFYLDAHWNEELPLEEELGIIFSACARAIVLVDDFEVPGDMGYKFDDYGPGKALNANYVLDVVKVHDLVRMYPTTASDKETGAKRGCVVLARREAAQNLLGVVSLLSHHED